MDAEDTESFREFVGVRFEPLPALAYLTCGDWQAAEDAVTGALARLYLRRNRPRRSGPPSARRLTRRHLADLPDLPNTHLGWNWRSRRSSSPMNWSWHRSSPPNRRTMWSSMCCFGAKPPTPVGSLLSDGSYPGSPAIMRRTRYGCGNSETASMA
ncbi:hypothetical protein [Paractinoplanes toevensis]|uniref:Uncharacterized protein n=1 Tax=Paractinoplanes toevensis TaxID=571911 RepID=A0A919T7P2_9ACTN|nr:hypothetical protein [Actinoplanes toevensis]GIM90668.1 hypothetical protein Ato02nite_024610 [Actinoplanes toevensis]